MDVIYYVLRYVNIVVNLTSIICLIVAALQKQSGWSTWSEKTRDHWWAEAGMAAVVVYGTFETLRADIEPGSRILVTTCFSFILLRAVTKQGADSPNSTDGVWRSPIFVRFPKRK